MCPFPFDQVGSVDLLHLLGDTILLGTAVLLSKLVILAVERGGLLLEGLDVLVTELDLALEAGDLTGVTGHGELRGLLGVLVGTLELLELLLETEDLENHDVGAVEDQGEEESETAEVHVALGVKLASLDLETLVTHDGSTVDLVLVFCVRSR